MKQNETNLAAKDEEENFYNSCDNYNPILNAPLTEEQKDRMNKFRNFLIQDAMNVNTQDLLQNIANVITDTNIDTEAGDRPNNGGLTIKSGPATSFLNNFFSSRTEENNEAPENNRVISGDLNPPAIQENEPKKKYA